jgi:hypothetical protein
MNLYGMTPDQRRQWAELEIAAARSAVTTWERCAMAVKDGDTFLTRARQALLQAERKWARVLAPESAASPPRPTTAPGTLL